MEKTKRTVVHQPATTTDWSPWTPFNGGKGRTERRVLRGGKWVQPDAEEIKLRGAIFGKSIQDVRDERDAEKAEVLAKLRN